MKLYAAAALLAGLIATTPAFAQNRADCPPGVTTGSAPKLDRDGNRVDPGAPLGDKLARSDGIICPPEGVDPEMQVQPKEGGELRVIPPPGSPGGDPRAQPK